ncbi:BamA/TamA family outer membrane protein [Vibrio sp. La 4.2.2]|uniref:BamA/TamA family outer membrane protein n=1 Tax=Vibrio sp. La 4.2.2 TaxID=2998830 RepID=UPI0022CDF228|nr:BamA/TamA family outer membrane protein [Vibrio sp. La 4.2.2]MDA0109573.1 BamA/TamA family outer membrane protein [Vibrio sp. La 4.2.2]
MKKLPVWLLGGMAAASSVSAMEQFLDPKDGMFDASQWVLDNAVGFMPVPIIITDPAVGAGGGAALLFFHESEKRKQLREENPDEVVGLPPSVTAVAAAATENGSWLTGAFHFGSWQEDTWRYQGGLFYGSFNLKYYEGDIPFDFNIDGLYFMQDIDYRIAGSDWFVGAKYSILSSQSTFDIGNIIPGIPPIDYDMNDAGVELKVTYDSRDTIFTPNDGLKAKLSVDFHNSAFGGDVDYQKGRFQTNYFAPLANDFVLGLRGDYQTVSNDAPYYARPFISMRGIPAMRYQGDDMALVEVEARYDLTPRWSLIGFTGTGKAFDEGDSFSDAKYQNVVGGGFRYLVARQLNMRAGVDVAKGPEEWAYYITVGHAWQL